MADLYSQRGVSSRKEEVHAAIRHQSKGLYPDAFCKVVEDIWTGSPEHALMLHADTAGTKTVLAYLYWRETGELWPWRHVVQDALVMNLDDMACAGATTGFLASATLGRNKNLIPAEVLKTIIEAAQEYADYLGTLGISLHLAGGETADVGDVVRTADVGYTLAARLPRQAVRRIAIQPRAIIIGIGSQGTCGFDRQYNSGIGANGLTYARHEVLSPRYAQQYPESYDPALAAEVVYQGPHALTDPGPVPDHTVGQLLLSPTRTHLPLLHLLPAALHSRIQGIIHCTGGGQTKVLHYLKGGLRVVKDNLFPVPPVFQLIQQARGADWQELYQVFNMGHRLELYVDPEVADDVLALAASLQLPAQRVGYVDGAGSSEAATVTLWPPHLGRAYTYTA